MAIELVSADDLRVGDRVIPEAYDEKVGLDGYAEDVAWTVTDVIIDRRSDRVFVNMSGPEVTLPSGEPVMRVRR